MLESPNTKLATRLVAVRVVCVAIAIAVAAAAVNTHELHPRSHHHRPSAPVVGGLGEELPADERVRQLLHRTHESIRRELRERHSLDAERLEPLTYKTQTVAGRNYFIKARVEHPSLAGREPHVHLRIYEPIGGEPVEFVGLVGQQTRQSSIEYF